MPEDLLPRGLPYGDRQRTIEQMRAAGLPTDSAGVDPSLTLPGGGGAPGGPGPVAPLPLGGEPDDPLLRRTPRFPHGTPNADIPVSSPAQQFVTRAKASPNAFLREIADLIPEYL